MSLGVRDCGQAMVCIEEFHRKAALELALKHRSNSEMWRSGGRLFLKGHPRRRTSMSKGRVSRTVEWVLITTRSGLIGVQRL